MVREPGAMIQDSRDEEVVVVNVDLVGHVRCGNTEVVVYHSRWCERMREGGDEGERRAKDTGRRMRVRLWRAGELYVSHR